MMVQTIDGMINEPIGAYSTEEEAQKWLEAAHDRFTADTVVFNIIPVKLDDKPPVLEFSEEMMDKSVAHQLFDLYDKDVFEQMVNGTTQSGVPANQRLVGTDAHRKYVEKLVPGSEWGLQFINKYKKK